MAIENSKNIDFRFEKLAFSICCRSYSKQQKKQTLKFRFVMAEKKIAIEGMTCGHCSARVEKALNSIAGVKAEVDLASNTAKVSLSKDVTDEVLKSAIVDAGYQVTSID